MITDHSRSTVATISSGLSDAGNKDRIGSVCTTPVLADDQIDAYRMVFGRIKDRGYYDVLPFTLDSPLPE